MAKKRGTSTAAIVLGIVGGAIDLPAALCSGVCAGVTMAVAEAGDEASSAAAGTYTGLGIAAGIIAIVFGCFAKKSPILAGLMLLVATVLEAICALPTVNIFGIAGAILTLISAIICFVQKKEEV